MNTRKIIAGIVLTACSVYAPLSAASKGVEQSVSQILSRVNLLERPAFAAQLVSKASKSDKQRVALEVVTAIAKTDVTLLATVVGAVISEVPSAAASVASTAAQLAPERLFEIAKAAAVSAPKKAEDVALALAALQPKELLKICLAVGRGAPSEVGRVVIPMARAFPMQFDLVYAGLIYGAPEQESAISAGLLKAFPGLENTAFGAELRKTRAGLATTGGTQRRKVNVANTTLQVIKNLANTLEKSLGGTSANVSGTSISSFASVLLSGAIKVNTTTGTVTIDITKIDASSPLAQAFTDTSVADKFASDASAGVLLQINTAGSSLDTALQNEVSTGETVDLEEVVTVILSKDTVRAYNAP